MTGKLIIAATPLGNDADASPRLCEALENSPYIAAEDTRRALNLMGRLNINYSGKLISFYDHNEKDRIPYILNLLQDGTDVLIISDAGMPLINDPGYRLVRTCIEHKIELTVLPGPSAVITALVMSGIAPERFIFEGFAPRRVHARREWLREIKSQKRTVIFFESPHRVVDCLTDIYEILGAEREIALCRELTKKHEEVVRLTAENMLVWAKTQTIRGEITLVIGPNKSTTIADVNEVITLMHTEISQGKKIKTVAGEYAQNYGLRSKDLYDAYIICYQTDEL